MSRDKRLTAADILHTLHTQMPELRQRYKVRSLGLFGSYAKDRPHLKSDVDLLVEFDQPLSLLRFIELEQHLTEMLGIQVDLVMKNGLKPSIGRRILEEVVPI